MMTTHPYTTLFLLMSVDGKISTGDIDDRDVDIDFPNIPGVKEGLHQYYEIEQKTDWFSFNSGRVMTKVGANTKPLEKVQKIPVCFVIIDNKPHLNTHGVEYMARRLDKLYLVTTNKNHPAYSLQKQYPNIVIMPYETSIDFADLFRKLRTEHKAERMTVQSGGEMNAVLLRAGLIDRVLLVIAPCLIGGRNTTTLVEGELLRTVEDLAKIRPLRLKDCTKLKDSYLQVEYEVAKS